MNSQNKSSLQPKATEMLVWISNLRSLVAVFGKEFLEAAKQAVQRALTENSIPANALQCYDEIILIRISTAWEDVEFNAAFENEASLHIQAILESIPVTHQGSRAYLKIQVGFVREPKTMRDMGVQCVISGEIEELRQPLLPELHESWLTAYREDMEKSVRLLDDMYSDKIYLAFQPVYLLENGAGSCPLYHEVLLRHEQRSTYLIHESIAALERLQLVSRLDRNVIWSAISTLENYRDKNLGVNISALSLRNTEWWKELFVYLDRNPDTAKRLIVEITETSSITQPDEALAITAGLQARGTRVALDDVGSGQSTLTFLAQANADLVKIDRSILLRSRDLRHSPDLLRNLVRVCADYSPCVIVEGIESEVELRAARYARASAVQGFLLGRPAIHPDWLYKPVALLRNLII